MGGQSCAVPHFAIMADAKLPVQTADASDPQYVSSCISFDAKMRQEYAQSDIVKGIVDMGLAPTVCPLLAKGTWTAEERETLWNSLLSLWPQSSWW